MPFIRLYDKKEHPYDKKEHPFYKPNFISTAVTIAVLWYFTSNWVGYSLCNCEDYISHGWIIFWSIVFLPFLFLVLRSWFSLASYSIKVNSKYGFSKALTATIMNLAVYSLKMVAWGVVGIITIGLISLLLGGVDLELEPGMDSADMDLGDNFDWEDSGETNMQSSDTYTDQDQSPSTEADQPPLEHVSGYTRADGTEVEGYVRTKADGNPFNNLNS